MMASMSPRSASVSDLGESETKWRPSAESNNIALIVRHLAIEARWHLDSLEHGTVMPFHPSPELQHDIDAVPIDFAANLSELTRCLRRFLELLRETSEEQPGESDLSEIIGGIGPLSVARLR